MQKIILDTIEQLNKEFGEYCPIAHKTVVSKKLADFLKQALTKAFEAGQKSREKEIVEKLDSIMIKVPAYRSHNTMEDTCFNLGVLEAKKILTK